MKPSKENFTKSTLHIKKRLFKKLVVLLLAFIFSFSTESVNNAYAKFYFFQGYENLQNRNFTGAIQDFTKAYVNDKQGIFGELAYLYLGKSYALLSYHSGKKEGVFSAISFLNLYPFFYKKANYVNLQREFIADSYLLLDMYDKSIDILSDLYRKSSSTSYLIKLAYASVLAGSKNVELLTGLNPKDLVENEDLYYLVQGYAQFNAGNYALSIEYLSKAREINRYLENDEHFLYRYAVSYYMLDNWKKAVFYMEILTRKDIYQKYRNFVEYYLALIYLKTENYKDALSKIEGLVKDGLYSNPIARLLYSQIWAYPNFMEKYKDRFPDYPETLIKIAWLDLNNQLSIPSILGIYYLSLKEKKVIEREILKLKNLTLPKEVQMVGVKANLDTPLTVLKQAYEKVDPYDEKNAEFIKELYKTNPRNFSLLFGNEKLARALVYTGDPKALEFANSLDGPVGLFLSGQAMLLEGNLGGLNLIEKALKDLKGEDKVEALFILGIMKRNTGYLEEALRESKTSARLNDYLVPAIFELADIYYKNKNYKKAKELYKRLVELLKEENDMYWIAIFRLAFSSKMLGDTETLKWVVDKVRKKDGIIGRVILELWE